MEQTKVGPRHSLADLRQMQSLPLECKIAMSQERIRKWYDHFDGQVYVAFSGGKDSTVLKHLVETTVGVYDVPCVFVNTGLEYPEIQNFVRQCKEKGDNIEIIRPKMRFDEVIREYGYPFPTKAIARKISDAQKGLEWVRPFFDGVAVTKEGKPSRFNCPKYKPLIDSPYKFSSKCCDVMKKDPFRIYGKATKRVPIVATMAEESQQRLVGWLKTGCNAFGSSKAKSQPMSFWTEQDVLEYIVKHNLSYATIYGEIEQDEAGKYYTTGADRTGCMFCMFGCHLERTPNRFQRMKETHPKQYGYCMNQLGLKEVLDYVGVDYE